MKSAAKNIVTIGGGTGSYRVLSGIKNISNISISAIVSMADDGGSTGRIRKDFGVLPPGDIRQCLAALAPSVELHDFLKYRFDKGDLAGHVSGNIFLAALVKTAGSFEKGLEMAMKILQTRGTVIPVTLDNAELSILLSTGENIEGESNIGSLDLNFKDIKKIFYKNRVKLNPKAAQALKEADYIIVCPGDFFTSIVPNLIVDGFKEALAKSKAKIIAIENLDDKKTEDYLTALEQYLGKSIDNVISEDKSLVSKEPVVKESGDTIKRSTLRHDSKKLAEAIEKIIS